VERAANAQTKLYTVVLTVPSDVSGLLSGMFADVTFHTDTSANAIVIPSEAIMTSGETQYVFVVEDDTAKYVENYHRPHRQRRYGGHLRPHRRGAAGHRRTVLPQRRRGGADCLRRIRRRWRRNGGPAEQTPAEADSSAGETPAASGED
jgi:multidrug efflux pump subunit AcrA (membrane-fusion protein)